jgi:hypothetical protein
MKTKNSYIVELNPHQLPSKPLKKVEKKCHNLGFYLARLYYKDKNFKML